MSDADFSFTVDRSGVTLELAVDLERGDSLTLDADALIEGGWVLDSDAHVDCLHVDDVECYCDTPPDAYQRDVLEALTRLHDAAGHVGALTWCELAPCKPIREAVEGDE